MSTVNRANRKASDTDIVRMNSVGLSLATIAEVLDCHPSTIAIRLNSLGIAQTDTRRSFMEDVLKGMAPEQLEWLADEMEKGVPIKDYVRNLIVGAYNKR
jgi:hypothetical protein